MKNIINIIILITVTISASYAQWSKSYAPGSIDLNKLFQISDIIYATTSLNYGTYKSQDNGDSWYKGLEFENGTPTIQDIISFENNIYVGTYKEGVLKSTNEVKDWSVISDGLIPYRDSLYNVKQFISNGKYLYASNHEGFYRKQEQSDNWDKIIFFDDKNSDPSCLAADNDVLYCGFSDNGDYSYMITGILKSTNNGDTWEQIAESLFGVKDILVTDEYILAVTSEALHRTKKDEINWEYLTHLPFNYPSNFKLSIFNDKYVILSFYEGVAIYDNTTKENKIITDSLEASFYNDIIITDDNAILISTSQGLFKSYDEGDNWLNIKEGIDDAPRITWLSHDKDDIYAVI